MRFFKEFIKTLLGSRGWVVYRFDPHQIVPANVPDPQLYKGPELTHRLFRPWLGQEYDRWFGPEVVEHTMLSRQKLYFLLSCLRQTLHLPGDIFEAGVGSGGSSRLMLECLRDAKANKRMWLLDTFEGYQKIDAAKDGDHVRINQCHCDTKEEVARLLANDAVEINLIKGLIPGTLVEVKAETLCFAHIDVNLYEPTRDATQFALERLAPGGIVVFDDYCWPATYGARQAIDEVCRANGLQPICLPESTQAFLINK